MTDQPGLIGSNNPLAFRMRPRLISEVVGQAKILAAGSPLSLLAKPATDSNRGNTSVILWGPPGTGKTTIAKAIASSSGRRFVELSAITSGVKELREAIDKARIDQDLYSVATILFLDEIHRFSKAQQDVLLPAVEGGWIVLIAATTENPSFAVISPLLSRSLVAKLEPLSVQDISLLIERSIADPRGLNATVSIESIASERICEISGGDARRALTLLEAAAGRASDLQEAGAKPIVKLADVEAAMESAAVRYDKDGDQHYDTISAFIKSVRGSDPDAAIHYLARMIKGGEDPRFIARRLVILASEDIGLADPQALPLAVAAADTVSLIGMPEGRIALAEVTIYLSLAPKSNSAYLAINQALLDVENGFMPSIPQGLRSTNIAKRGAEKGYEYPHDDPRAIVPQDYLSDYRSYYHPKAFGFELNLVERFAKIKAILRGNKDNR
jgi:putative ATPase